MKRHSTAAASLCSIMSSVKESSNFSGPLLVITVFLSVLVTPLAAQGCSDGWKEYRGRCYIVDVNEAQNFEGAKVACNFMGAALASVPDGQTAQFISQLINQTWSTIDYCQSEHLKCKTDYNKPTCAQMLCLNFWIGLYHNETAPCAGCSPGGDTLRQGWRWLDGAAYNAPQTIWADSKPSGYTNPGRFGVFDSSLELQIGDAVKDLQIGFICCKPSGCANWSPTPKTSSISAKMSTNAVRFTDYPTLTQCQAFCISVPQCVAVDFDSSTDTSRNGCWVHTNPDNLAVLYDAPYVSQFDLNRTCPSNQFSISTTTLLNTLETHTTTHSTTHSSTTHSTTHTTTHTTAKDNTLTIGLAAGIGGGVALIIINIIINIIITVIIVKILIRRNNAERNKNSTTNVHTPPQSIPMPRSSGGYMSVYPPSLTSNTYTSLDPHPPTSSDGSSYDNIRAKF